MVHAMPYDRGGVPRVAWIWLILLPACVPAAVPTGPGPGDGTQPAGGGVVNHVRLRPAAATGRQVVIGEMCPLGVGGRPGLAPIGMRGVQWTDVASEIADVIERGSVPQFSVYGVDGKVAGEFETLGLADIAPGQPIVSGGYAGASPCTYEVTPSIPDAPNVPPPPAPAPTTSRGPAIAAPPSSAKGSPIAMRAEDPRCVPSTGGCGLAVGEIVHPDDPPGGAPFVTGGACVSGDELVVDIDGDGVPEAFPLAGVLDGIRGPAGEWTAAPLTGSPCKPSFQVFDVRLPDSDPSRAPDPRTAVSMDVLGVIDVDGDGRRELVLALRFPTVRSIVIYTPSGSAQRLALAGEATSFPR